MIQYTESKAFGHTGDGCSFKGIQGNIKKILVGIDTSSSLVIVDGLKVSFVDGREQVYGLTYMSNEYITKNQHNIVKLEADEKIITVFGRCGSRIDSIGFKTDKERTFGPYGGSGGGEFVISEGPVFGFHGTSQNVLLSLGVYHGPKTNTLPLKTPHEREYSGKDKSGVHMSHTVGACGTNNSTFKSSQGIIKKIEFSRSPSPPNIIVGFKVTFVDVNKELKTEKFGDDYRTNVFTLDDDEEIIEVFGKCGDCIDSLGFRTNKERTFGPDGGVGGSNFKISQGPVLGFYGCYGWFMNRTVVGSLGVIHGPHFHAYLNKAMQHLKEQHPEKETETKKLENNIISDIKKTSLSDIMEHANKNLVRVLSETITSEITSDCNIAFGSAVLSLFLYFLGLMGVRAAYNESFRRSILRDLGVDFYHGLGFTIHHSLDVLFDSLSTKIAKAGALFSIFGQIFRGSFFKVVFLQLFKDYDWYDYARVFAVGFAQFLAWSLSDGVAFYATVYMNIDSFVSVVMDSVKLYQSCKIKLT